MSAILPKIQTYSSITRTTVRPDEALSLNLHGQTVEVIAGVAWISWNGEDILLTSGASLTFGASAHTAVISAMRRTSVTLDIMPAA